MGEQPQERKIGDLCTPEIIDLLKDRLGDQREGSEWELIKILLQRENSAYAPNSQPRIPTRVCQAHVVIVDLETLGTHYKQSQSESTNQEAKDLVTLRSTRWTVRELRAYCPRAHGGPSAWYKRTVRKILANIQYCTNNNGPSVEAPRTIRDQHPPRGLSTDHRRTVRQTPCN
jgi:hypothetical protein